jgi:cell division protein ZipA
VPELRWILLGAGIALMFGIWWWETRRPRPAGEGADGEPDHGGRSSPTLTDDAQAASDPGIGGDSQSWAAQVAVTDRSRVERRPPLIEIPEDMVIDVSEFVGHEPGRQARQEARPEAGTWDQEFVDLQPEGAQTPSEPYDEQDDHHRAPWVRTQPLERDEIAPRREEEEPAPPADEFERRTAEASQQRIVALRLIAADGLWNGAELLAALEAQGLEFGPYSVFHRPREDGKSLFFVASMMEPGSFDLGRMREQEFPGVSLFGVVPGPLEAPAMFDLLLATGRSLAERLKGQLQDEQGSTLTAQRILNLREELVHLEHRTRRLRRI